MTKRNAIHTIMALLIILLLFEIVDYFDLPTTYGIKIKRLNNDAQAIAFDCMLTILVFVLAYYYVNRWEVKKHINQYKVAQQLLLQSYKQCVFNIEWLDDRVIRDFILNTRNGQIRKDEDMKGTIPYEKIPFQNDEMILQICTEGVISDDQLIPYIQIKSDFAFYVSYLSLHKNDSSADQERLIQKSKLLTKINKEISQIEQNIKPFA